MEIKNRKSEFKAKMKSKACKSKILMHTSLCTKVCGEIDKGLWEIETIEIKK